MTYIKKLVMKGFKSFARETVIHLDQHMNCIVGPNGSGKCVAGESLIQKGDGSIERIDSIVNSRLDRAVKTEDGFLIPGDGTEVFCLDTDKLKIHKKPIKAFVKRTSPETLLKIRTRSGREVKTTKYHPLFILEDNQVVAAKAEELKEGTRIAVPRKMHFSPENKHFVELLDKINETDGIYIPYKEEFKLILNSVKDDFTWKQLAEKIGVSFYVIKGLLNKQSVNLFYLIKILKYANLSNHEMTNFLNEFISNGKKTGFSFENSKEFSRFFGYILAEGRLAESSQIWFTNGDKEIVKDYINLVKKLFNKDPLVREYKPNCWDVIIFSEPLKKILKKLGMASKTEDKEISSIFLKHSSDEEISELLNGLYCGDGYISDRSIEITTKSKKLAKAIECCLLRLGINFSEKKVIKGIKETGFSGEYYNVVIYGVDNFIIFNKNISLVHNMKREKILNNLDKKSNPNLDLIEANQLVKKISNEQNLNIKKSKISFPRIDSYVYNQCIPSRSGLQFLRKELFLKNSESIELFDKLIYSDIFWDEIIEIQEINGEDWVYDLCVEKNHNFIANNVLVHNSNITDALCFVLGRLSIKSIRAAKASHLIFSGNKEYKSAIEAFVEITLDNSDKTFALETPDIIIKRIVKKNGQSVYKINNEVKTRQEVLELLAQAGIDPHGFNIILQGEIERFVKMPPEERKKVLEEVAGISVYEMRKEKSLKELEKTEERLKQINAILRERTNYLKNLESEREEALKFKKLEETVKRCKASIINKYIQEKDKVLFENFKKLEIKKKEIEKIENQINKIKEEINVLNEKIENISKKIQQSSGIEQDSLMEEISTLKQDIAGYSARKENFENQLLELDRRRQNLSDSIKISEKEIELMSKEKVKDKKKELEEKKAKLDNLEELKRQFYLLKSNSSSINIQIDDKKRQIQRLKNDSNLIISQIENIEKEIHIKENLEKNREVIIQLKHSIERNQLEISRLEKELLEKEKLIAVQYQQIEDSEKIKSEVSKLDICPLCKTKITKEHVEEVVKKSEDTILKAQEIIKETENNIKKIKNSLNDLREKISLEHKDINQREMVILKFNNIEDKKQQLKRNEEQIKILEEELKNLTIKQKTLENKLSTVKLSEEQYENLKLEVNELQRSEERNLGIEISTKQRELERIKIAIKQNLRDKDDISEQLKDIVESLEEKQEIVEKKEEQAEILKKKYQKMFEEKNNYQDKVRFLESNLLKEQNEKRILEMDSNNLMIEKAQENAKKETLLQELKEYKEVEFLPLSLEGLKEKLTNSEQTLARIGSVNLRALEVYDEIKNEYDKIREKVDQLEKEKLEILKVIEQIDRKKKRVFLHTLEEINKLFSRNFSELSAKGIVTLEPINPKEVFEDGLDITVKVSGGKYFDVTSLSGGEQTLVALSLIFSIQEYRPYCFYIFDEIDAALDRRNSEKLAQLLKRHMKKGQYLLITHNDSLISESSNILYGVSMQEGISKVLSIEV